MYIFFVLSKPSKKFRFVKIFKKFVSKKIKVIVVDDILLNEFLKGLKLDNHSCYIYKLLKEYYFFHNTNSFICTTKNKEDMFCENLVYLKLQCNCNFEIEEVSSEYKRLVANFLDIQKAYEKYSKTLDSLYVNFVRYCLYEKGISKCEFEEKFKQIESFLKNFSDKYTQIYSKDFVYNLIFETYRKFGSSRKRILKIDYKL